MHTDPAADDGMDRPQDNAAHITNMHRTRFMIITPIWLFDHRQTHRHDRHAGNHPVDGEYVRSDVGGQDRAQV